jgi:glycosyltransferase involved in cell wall biosynthesis
LPWLEGTPDTLDASLFEPQRLIANYSNLETLRARAKQEWLNAHACDSLLVNSYFSRESILRSYAVEAKVCYLGVDTKLFRDLRLEREGFLVGVGAFEPTKGIELAVRAVSMLDEPRPTLVWIANARNESYESRTREVARSLGVELQDFKQSVSHALYIAT